MNDSILIRHAYLLEKQREKPSPEPHELKALLHSGEKLWIHLSGSYPDMSDWIAEHLPTLDPLIVKALTTEHARPRAEMCEDGLLFILRGVNLNEHADPEDMVSVRLWANHHVVLTIGNRHLKAVSDIAGLIEAGKPPYSPAGFLSTLCLRIMDRMEPTLTAMMEAMDDIEEYLIEGNYQRIRQLIIAHRRRIILFSRNIAPQKEAIAYTLRSRPAMLENRHIRHLQEALNRTSHYLEHLESLRERLHIVQDEMAHLLNSRLNRHMYILSIITAIFMPLTFVTGMLGMNVGGIPFADHPHGLRMIMLMLGFILIGQLLLLKRMKWF